MGRMEQKFGQMSGRKSAVPPLVTRRRSGFPVTIFDKVRAETDIGVLRAMYKAVDLRGEMTPKLKRAFTDQADKIGGAE